MSTAWSSVNLILWIVGLPIKIVIGIFKRVFRR